MFDSSFLSSLPVAIILALLVFSPRLFRWFQSNRQHSKLDADGHRAVGLLSLAQKEAKNLYETGRSRLEETGNARKDGKTYTLDLTKHGEFVRGLIFIDTKSQGAPGKREHFKQTEIMRDKTLYSNDGKGWNTVKVRRTQPKMFGNAADPAFLGARLMRATDIKSIGRRTIEGIECNAFSYSIPADKVDIKRDLFTILPHFDPKATIICDRCDGQFAIGVEDLVVHQDVQFLTARTKGEPNDWCDMKRTFTVWALGDDVTAALPPDLPESPFK